MSEWAIRWDPSFTGANACSTCSNPKAGTCDCPQSRSSNKGGARLMGHQFCKNDAACDHDTTSGDVKVIKVGREPHGLAVWPQPGRYSLGHTGNMR